MLNYTFMVVILSIFLIKFIPANDKTPDDDLDLSPAFCAAYAKNFSKAKHECLFEIVNSTNNTQKPADLIDQIDRSMYIRRNHKDIRCWYGCVCRKMKLMNATNAVVDEELKIFARVLVNDTHTEDEIDDDCADLEDHVRGLDYCDMGFKLYICIIDQMSDYD